MATSVITVNDMLDGHVELDLECLDRVYLNLYVPKLQVGGQVTIFLRHRDYPIISPACLGQIGHGFRRAVQSYAEANDIPMVKLRGDDRKIDLMRPYLDRAAASGRSQVAAIGVAQEYQSVFAATEQHASNGIPWFSFYKADRRVTCYYFYIWDTEFGPAFVKVCSYFPYPGKVYLLTELRKAFALVSGLSAGVAATVLVRGRVDRSIGTYARSCVVGRSGAGRAAGDRGPIRAVSAG